MKKALISLTAASALMISTAAFAGGGKHKGPEAWFNKMDQNQDGKITQAEARAAKDEHFNRLDANGDGSLTPDRSEEHTSELQSRPHLVCRLLLEKKNVLHP